MSDKQRELRYKVLNDDGSCFHGGHGSWHLPANGKRGKWMPKITGDLKPCARGYHVLRREHIAIWIGPAIWTVECKGAEIWQSDKGVVQQARLVKRLDWTEQKARLYCCDFSEYYKSDLRADDQEMLDNCLRVIRRHLFGLATDAELNSIIAVLDDKWARAWAGARARAWAGAGAWAPEEKDWATKRIFAYIDDKMDLDALRKSLE